MKKNREESMVCLQSTNEISLSLSNSIIRRRFGENSSVGWYNLDKTKPVKGYKCSEFDDYIRKADSSKYFLRTNDLKHRQQEKAIVSDLEFEVQEQDKELQSSECDSYDSNFEDSDSDEVWQISDCVERKKLKLKGELKTHHDQKNFNMNHRDWNRENGKYSTFEVNIDQQDATETSLFDVHLTVKASHRAENVPFVCLTSQLNGNAIMGYPLEIEKPSDVCETLLPRRAKVDPMFFDEERIRFCQLLWKTAKRTPVCYVPNPLSSSLSKNVPARKDDKVVEDSITADKENRVLAKEKSVTKFLNDPKKFNHGKEAKIGSCVRVELIFGKILTAVAQRQS